MFSICSVRTVMSKLDDWGFGETSVHRMGEKLFLFTIEDEDLYIMLEDATWSYLRRCCRALCENVNHVKDCEKVIILISTQNVKKIEELVEIEVGNVIHLARVMEINFSDNSGNARKDSSRSGPSEKARWSKLQEEDEALNAWFVGKEANNAGQRACCGRNQ
ncbi:hypothetical protein V6N13_064920 [Hibiscus sabdariffa]